jgi:sec-independent protein translocase protein TatC
MELPETSPDKMNFWQHLQELRVRIVRSLLVVLGIFVFAYGFPFGYHGIPSFRFKVWAWAQQPFLKAMARETGKAISELQPFAFTDLGEPFFSMMRLSLWTAAFIAAPFLFYELWAFIRPGLLARERRLVLPFVFITSGCFLAGAAFAYVSGIGFLSDILFQEAAAAGLRANLHASAYLDLFIWTMVVTGIMFELPVLFYFLARFRIVTAKWMIKYWRHATLIIVMFSAFFTPGDAIATALFFSVVLLGLYAVSILVAWLAEPRQPR